MNKTYYRVTHTNVLGNTWSTVYTNVDGANQGAALAMIANTNVHIAVEVGF